MFQYFLPSTFTRKVWGQDRRICSLILGLKGKITNGIFIQGIFILNINLLIIYQVQNFKS